MEWRFRQCGASAVAALVALAVFTAIAAACGESPTNELEAPLTSSVVTAPPSSSTTLVRDPTPVASATPRPTADRAGPPGATVMPAQRAPSEQDFALILSAAKGDLSATRALLTQGARVDVRDARGETALIAAVRGNYIEVAGALVAAGANVNTKDNGLESAYLIATSEIGDSPRALEMLRLMLRSGADVDSLDSYNGTGLIRAADRGFTNIVSELLKTRIKVDHVNRLGWTALLEAIILGRGDAKHVEVLRILVAAGANVNLADGNGKSPLAHARERGYSEMVNIIESAATVRALNAELGTAAESADGQAVERLLRAGANPNSRNERGEIPLLVATHKNLPDIARLLIAAGADVNAKDAIDDSPYLYAAAEGRLEILKLTLTNGADLRSLNRYGGTGLIPAAHHGHVEVVRELLKTDIDVNHVNKLGWTALLEAVILGDGSAKYVEIVRLLVEGGANVNLADRASKSPAAHARERGHAEIVRTLESVGAR